MDTLTFECEYSSRIGLYEKLKNVAMHQMNRAISAAGLKVRLDKRIKSALSLYKKAERKGIENPFEQIHDIVGLKAVCLYLSDLEKVRLLLSSTFEVIHEDDRSEGTDPKTFGWLGVNCKVKLRNPTEEHSDIKDIAFEIQLQTEGQNAWALVSHDLDYKKASPIPDRFRREFYALSGLLHVADRHFDGLREEHAATPVRRKQVGK